MIKWEAVKAAFAWEGSWRDICVQGVALDDWRLVLQALTSAGVQSRFSIDGAPTDVPSDPVAAFDRLRDTRTLWSVLLEGVVLNCHFFDASEIEFDLDPREVRGQAQLDGLLNFMRILASVTGRPALMTPENSHRKPFFRVAPSGKEEYISWGKS